MLDRIYTVDLGRMDVRPNGRILDVGCGMARHLQQAVRGPYYVVGVDFDHEELRRAKYVLGMVKGWHPDVTLNLVQGDGTCLPFPDESFDHVICSETLEHVPDDDGMLEEIKRVLRPGGTLAVSVPHHFVETLLWRLNPRIPLHPGGHIRIYGPREMSRKLKRQGFVLYQEDRREAFESVFWLLVHGFGENSPLLPMSKTLRRFLNSEHMRKSVFWARAEEALSRVLPKSIVLYGRKPGSPTRRRGTTTTTVA